MFYHTIKKISIIQLTVQYTLVKPEAESPLAFNFLLCDQRVFYYGFLSSEIPHSITID